MKKIFFALLSASLVFFAACQQEPSVKLSDDAEVLGYKPSTFSVTVESAGSWTLQGSYDWVTPSKTSGNGGETISFATTLNVSGLIRTADYTIVSNGDEIPVTIYQKSGTLDAVLGLSVVGQGVGSIELALDLITSNSDDYAEYGVYYGTSADIASAKRQTVGTDMNAGTKSVKLTGLSSDADYYVWAYVAALEGTEVVSSAVGVLPPVFVDASVTDFQAVLNSARPYSEVRVAAGLKFNGNFEAKSNLKISGGWNADFSAQSDKKEDYLVLDGNGEGTTLAVDRAVVGFSMNRVKIANGNARDGAGMRIDGKATIEYCWFDNNYCTHRGGAIGSTPDGALDPGESEYLVANSLFTRNASVEHGGVVCVDYNCNATFVNNLFTDNYGVCRDDYWHTFITYAGGVFVNNTFVANIMTNGRDTYAIFGAREDHEKRATYPFVFMNNIIVGNTTAEAGSGKYAPNEYPVPVKRNYCPVQISDFYTRTEDVVQNNLYEGYASNSVDNKFNTSNTIMAATDFGYTYPGLFADYANGNFALAAGASVVNAGTTSNATVSALLNKYSKDLAGNPRIVGGNVDLGCYEAQ